MVTEYTEEQIEEAFLGSAQHVPLKGNDGNTYDFYFEQFEIDDLPKFKVIIDKWFKCKCVIDFELQQALVPWVRKMIDISYPSWSKPNKEKFMKKQFPILCEVVLMANTLTLTECVLRNKDDEEMSDFLEAERKKQEALKSKEKPNGECSGTPTEESPTV